MKTKILQQNLIKLNACLDYKLTLKERIDNTLNKKKKE